MGKKFKKMKKNIKHTSDISLIMILRKLFNNVKIIYRTAILFFLFGLFISLNSQTLFYSYITFIPDNEGSSNPQLSGLASLAGVNVQSNSKYNFTSQYSLLFNDLNFKRELLKTKLLDSLTIAEYFTNNKNNKSIINNFYKYTLGLPNTIFSIVSDFINKKDLVPP